MRLLAVYGSEYVTLRAGTDLAARKAPTGIWIPQNADAGNCSPEVFNPSAAGTFFGTDSGASVFASSFPQDGSRASCTILQEMQRDTMISLHAYFTFTPSCDSGAKALEFAASVKTIGSAARG